MRLRIFNNIYNFFINFNNKSLNTFIILGIIVTIVSLSNARAPLVGVHWDSPIYLNYAKGYAETNFLTDIKECTTDYSTNAIRQETRNLPYCYAFYTRLGHIIVLGELIKLFGSTPEAIRYLSNCFMLMMAISVFISGLMSIELYSSFNKTVDSKAIAGLFISCFIYASSNLFSHLGNSLVSDVPSFLFVSAAGFCLIRGINCRSYWWTTLSGLFGFIAYAIRLESVWGFLSYILALVTVYFFYQRRDTWWLGFLISGLSCLFLFLMYFITLFPLGSPILYYLNAKSVKDIWFHPNADYGLVYFIRAGGLLWVGSLIYLFFGKPLSSRLSQFALIWLFFITVIWLPFLLEKGPTQTRHYILLTMPLIILSTLGWARAIDIFKVNFKRRFILSTFIIFICALNLISHTHNYKYLRNNIPGLWKLDFIWTKWYFGPTLFEQPTYPIDESLRISKAIYNENSPTLIIRRKEIQLIDNLYLIRFFGPSYESNFNYVKDSYIFGPETLVPCGDIPSILEGESTIYTSELPELCRGTSLLSNYNILRMVYRNNVDDINLSQNEEPVLITDHYIIAKVNY